MVRSDATVSWRTMPLEDARLEGATMLFGEKYGDLVRVVTVDGLTKELCGGTHLGRTGEIGSFLVRAETSVGSGLRRIEAVTGRGADAFVRQRLARLDRLSSTLGVTDPDVLVERVEELLARTKDLDRSLDALRADVARSRAAEIASGSVAVDGVPVVARRVEVPTAAVLREHIDALREQVPGAVIVLGAEVDGRPRLAVAVADGLVARGLHAGHLVKDLATELGGGGGGRATMAEAGGRDTTRLDAVLASVEDRVRGVLRGGAAGGPA
jgi:alanyl-tRNA synthetase